MVIRSKRREIWRDIQAILTSPHMHGIAPSNGVIRTEDILEVLVGSGRASWIAAQDIDEVIFAEGGDVGRSGDDAFPVEAGPPPLPATDMPRSLYAPRAKPGTPIARWYDDPANAFLAAAARTDDFSTAHIATTIPYTPYPHWAACAWGIFLHDGHLPLDVHEADHLIEKDVDRIRWRYWIDEIRYLTDDVAIGSATAKLYKTLPRDRVESGLLRLLDDPDRDVRINALTALGYLAYKSPMVPGAPLQDRATRLEDLSLSLETVRRIAVLLEVETDEQVLDHAVCTLRAQSFDGRLKDEGFRIRDILRRRLPQIQSESTRKDTALLLRSIPLY